MYQQAIATVDAEDLLPAPIVQSDPILAEETAVVPSATGSAASEIAAPVMPRADVDAEFVIGAWLELTTHRRVVRTQLTWTSPQKTLFLFTSADGSTQSMTRRMRDKLAADGSLRVVPAQLVATQPPGKPSCAR